MRSRSFCGTLAVWGLALLGGGSPALATTLWAAEGADIDRGVYTLDPATGAATFVGDSGAAMTGLAIHPFTGVIYGSTARISVNPSGSPQTIPTDSLVTIDPATGGATLVGSFGLTNATLADIAFHPTSGVLYGWASGSTGDLHTVDLATGVATLLGESGLSGLGGNGLAFDVSGTLWYAGAGTQGVLRTVSAASGSTTDGPTLSGYAFDERINSMTFVGNTLYGMTSSRHNLIAIDTTSGAITTIGGDVNIAIDGIAYPIPEPVSSALVALSLVALAVRSRRRPGSRLR